MLGTILSDRVLWYDGDSSIDPQDLERFTKKYPTFHPFVLEIDETVAQYNRYASVKITTKRAVNIPDIRWTIPEQYLTLDVKTYVWNKLKELQLTEQQVIQRRKRVEYELSVFEKHAMLDTLRAIIYVINTLTSQNAVWGVGRGSSVSSYVLYLIGVHDVDSVEYQIDFNDFLKDEEHE